jgi:rRNA maturation endonuclease Nob1
MKVPYLCTMDLKLILLSIGLLGLAFAGIAIKILAKKDGQFAGTCASNNPMLNKEGEACSICGARPQDKCRGDDAVA